MIKLENISKLYFSKSKEIVTALKNVNLIFNKQELTFIIGESGSGKTTLLNIFGGLDSQTDGKFYVDSKLVGKDISLEIYRQNYIGFVFQEYNLLDNLTVYDNIALAISASEKQTKDKVCDVLKKVNLSGFEKRRINELSGGQKQRVAIARALAKNCEILLCDEPTGNLDSKTSVEIFDLLKTISLEKNVIVVSHNEELAKKYSDRLIKISDGIIVYDQKNNDIDENKNIKPFETKPFKNRVSFRYKLKIAFKNLFYKKFKTFISFVLLFLSMLSMCAMEICISYNPERNIVKSISDKNEIVIMKNTSSSGVTNENPAYPLNVDLSNYVDSNNSSNLYRSFFGNIIVNECCDRSFYAKENLNDSSAYVTDYFIDIVNNLQNGYETLKYTNYEDLIGKYVEYDGNKLFTIAGVIKTDYKEYYDERGNIRKEKDYNYLNDINEKNTNRVITEYKLNYEFKTIYASSKSFENMYLGINQMFYDGESYSITISEQSYSTNVSNFSINFFDGQEINYFNNTGYFGSTNDRISDEEIVITGDLYNKLFGTNINWFNFARDYIYGIDSENPYSNQLNNLGKMIDIKIIDESNEKIIEIKNKKIIGVYSDESFMKEEKNYEIYGNKACFNVKNSDILPCVESVLNFKNIEEKYKLLTDLRSIDIVVMGAEAKIIYENEYIFKQISYFLIAVGVVLSILTIISTFNLINSKINDSKKEIGILMGIGFDNKEVIFIYLFSMIFLTLISIILTIIGIYVGVNVVNKLMQVKPFTNLVFFDVEYLTYITLFLTGIMILIFSLIPLLSFVNKKPIDVIKK